MLLMKLNSVAASVLAFGALAGVAPLLNQQASDSLVDAGNPSVALSTRVRRIRQVVSGRDGVIGVIDVVPGQTVQAGELLARLDDRQARGQVRIKEAKLAETKANRDAALKAAEDANARLDTLVHFTLDQAEIHAALFVFERYAAEVASRDREVACAEADLDQANNTLKIHEIRSPARGMIQTISKQRGEAVRDRETIFEINLLD